MSRHNRFENSASERRIRTLCKILLDLRLVRNQFVMLLQELEVVQKGDAVPRNEHVQHGITLQICGGELTGHQEAAFCLFGDFLQRSQRGFHVSNRILNQLRTLRIVCLTENFAHERQPAVAESLDIRVTFSGVQWRLAGQTYSESQSLSLTID